jgi:hypothetical protein
MHCRSRIAGLVKQAGANPTITERLDINRRKTRLDNMIDDFSRKVNQYLAEDILVGQGNTNSDWHNVELGDKAILPLPSNIGADQCRDHGVGYLVDDELKLRQGQANDTLHNIRINLSHHSFLYRMAVRQAKHSQHKKSRAWDTVHQVNTALNVHTAIYRRCRKAMIALGASSVLLQRYQELKEEHLQSKTIENRPKCHRNARRKPSLVLDHECRSPSRQLDVGM